MTTPTSLRARCPYCGSTVLPAKPPASRSTFFPFCSSRCKMADLQRWFKGAYVISQDIETLTPDQRAELEELEEHGTAVGEPK